MAVYSPGVMNLVHFMGIHIYPMIQFFILTLFSQHRQKKREHREVLNMEKKQ